MAGGLRPLFTSKVIRDYLQEQAEEMDRKTGQALMFLGEKFVNQARLEGNYTDRTGNLRSSIGYVVLRNGQEFGSNYEGKASGVARAKEFISEIKQEFDKGWVLIGVAGMKYAAYVEAKNYDVITGSVPSESIIEKLFSEINI
jgi:hypothetical protein